MLVYNFLISLSNGAVASFIRNLYETSSQIPAVITPVNIAEEIDSKLPISRFLKTETETRVEARKTSDPILLPFSFFITF